MSFPLNPDDPYGIERLRPKDEPGSRRARQRQRGVPKREGVEYGDAGAGNVEVQVEDDGQVRRNIEVQADTEAAARADVDHEPDEMSASASGIRKARKKRSGRRNLIEWTIVIVGAVVVAFLIKTFLVQAFYIPTSSMEPTLAVGDRVLVNKLSYRLHDVNRGDIVVFQRPDNAPPGDVDDLIKRVIALPGELIEVEDGRVLIDGEQLDEPYLGDGTRTPQFGASIPGCATNSGDGCSVPAEHVFVLGDNRDNSQASNVFGPVDEDLIVGRAFIRVWPIGSFGGI